MSDVAGQVLGEVLRVVLKVAIDAAFNAAINASASATPAVGAETIFVQYPAVIEATATHTGLLANCRFGGVISMEVVRSLSEKRIRTRTHPRDNPDAASLASGRALRLTVTEVRESRDDRRTHWAVSSRVDLLESGTLVSSRGFTHGVISSSRDTCKALDRLAEPLGMDASAWAVSQIASQSARR